MGREGLYGGAAGGGKSEALLMGALMFVDVPGYNAIIFRRTYPDLALPEALMDRSLEWLSGKGAHWDGAGHMWTFPSGARLAFGYLEADKDRFRYQSAAFQFIGFDELTQFTEIQYRYLFSRLRRLENVYVPLRMRAASNPGNIGHDWVKRRFMEEGPLKGRVFIPAKLADNPYLDQKTYISSLRELDPITRRQYLNGDWTAKFGGNKFQAEWFSIVDESPAKAPRVRYWDMAATTPKQGRDPDYTVGAKLAVLEGVYYIEDIVRIRETPRLVEKRIKLTADLDFQAHGDNCHIWMEVEPGSEGLSLVDHYTRNILQGYTFRGNRVTGDKELRANPVSSAAEAGNVKLIRGPWINAFLDEAESFPIGEHDDQIDAVSGAFDKLRFAGGFQVMTGEIPF
jgi:predicted phage terminase large subunit-like protein